jgi:hypothetical protein
LRRLQVRDVDHFAVDADRSCAGIVGEAVDDATCMRDLSFRGRIAAVDRCDLVRMDSQAPEEAVAA